MDDADGVVAWLDFFSRNRAGVSGLGFVYKHDKFVPKGAVADTTEREVVAVRVSSMRGKYGPTAPPPPPLVPPPEACGAAGQGSGACMGADGGGVPGGGGEAGAPGGAEEEPGALPPAAPPAGIHEEGHGGGQAQPELMQLLDADGFALVHHPAGVVADWTDEVGAGST